MHNAYGYGLFTGGLGAHYGAERLGCTVVPVSGGMTERQVTLMQDFGARVLCATPSYALNIAEVAEGMGVDLRKRRCGSACSAPSRGAMRMRRELEARLGIQAVDLYGSVRNHRAGRRLRMPRGAGRPARLGGPLPVRGDRSGNAASRCRSARPASWSITTLTKEALPMIRYRTRDITRLSDAPCACGRTHVRIMRVTGRNDDMMIIRGVNVYPSQIEAVLVGFPGLAPHYQIVLTREGALDAMTRRGRARARRAGRRRPRRASAAKCSTTSSR